MKQVSFLIKPASGLCNMRCRYCFYEDETANRATASLGRMTTATADTLIDAALAAVDAPGAVTFTFQGGEPTLAGLAYFEHFVAAVAEKNTKKIKIHYAMQTNGLSIDDDWASFLARHHFLVGVSVDGDKTLHDEFRVDAAQKGTYRRVIQTIEVLARHKVDTNLLCVVTKRCAKSAVKMYHALQKTGVRYLQFIACLDPLGDARGSQTWSLTPADYGAFLSALFDEWYRDWKTGHYTSVRLFDDYVHLAMGLPAGTCATSGSCGAYFVAEGDGSLYPCDFYCLDEWRLGRLGERPLEEFAACETERRFLAEGDAHPAECAACPWLRLCNGGCKRDWYRDDTGPHNYYCPAFRAFFEHAAPRLAEIARAEAAQRRR